MRIVILNGPNLNLLGRREPAIYGTRSMEEVLLDIQRAYPNLYIAYHQSNHEGDLIDWVQEYGVLAIGDWRLAMGDGQEVDGIVLNAGGYTHTSVSIRDAIAAITTPVLEVHISNIYAREEFRHISMLSEVCVGTIAGLGLQGYKLAIEFFAKK